MKCGGTTWTRQRRGWRPVSASSRGGLRSPPQFKRFLSGRLTAVTREVVPPYRRFWARMVLPPWVGIVSPERGELLDSSAGPQYARRVVQVIAPVPWIR